MDIGFTIFINQLFNLRRKNVITFICCCDLCSVGTCYKLPLFLLVIYALPLLLNFIVYKVQKGEWKFWTALVLPTVSVAAYLLFAYLTSSNGTWIEFAQMNMISDEDMQLDIALNLFDGSQILFISLLFYGVSLASHFISNKVSSKGVKHA